MSARALGITGSPPLSSLVQPFISFPCPSPDISDITAREVGAVWQALESNVALLRVLLGIQLYENYREGGIMILYVNKKWYQLRKNKH